LPTNEAVTGGRELQLLDEYIDRLDLKIQVAFFNCPEHKEATYSQCSRLYAAALDLPEDELLITSDVDMALLKVPEHAGGHMAIFGIDLVPPNQVPMCYISGSASEWRRIFDIKPDDTCQYHLDNLLSNISSTSMKSDYWAKDQEEAYNKILGGNGHAVLLPRARPGTQFALNRLDRDDAYILDRLSPDIVDFHMNRPGYEESNLNIILTVLKYFYPNDNFQWLIDYRNEYIKLL
jgi:hypothetical protein